MDIKDLAGLSEPVSKLIETVGKAVAGIAEPTVIRRRASAEADARVVRAEGEAAAEAVSARARRRIAEEEIRQQANLEAIVRRAAQVLPEAVSDVPVDPDWTAHFVREAKDTSNEEIQELWARLLAGEIESPGTFSRRTVNLVRMLEPDDARLFHTICQFSFNDDPPVPVIDLGSQHFEVNGIDFAQLDHLDSIGLVRFRGRSSSFNIEVKRFRFAGDAIPRTVIGYDNQVLVLDLSRPQPEGPGRLHVGHLVLTRAGSELARLVERFGKERILRYLIEFYAELKPASLLPGADEQIILLDEEEAS